MAPESHKESPGTESREENRTESREENRAESREENRAERRFTCGQLYEKQLDLSLPLRGIFQEVSYRSQAPGKGGLASCYRNRNSTKPKRPL
ncbi:hypothetical protein BgiMline_033479 [Biomphalaria glabrata]